ncbi:MAG: hypothetical protein QF376_03065 [Anaerolineales bacterium]|jgi:hypothetical protein|nr:hypothetical protein [Anaerolineales bacterium]HJO33016.1 hypothetical protein [Anaerolineales bacterium]
MREPEQATKPVDAVRRITRERPGVALGAFFVAGLLLGWMGLGWGLVPVEWKDAGPAQLHADFQREWVQMTSDSFILTTEMEQARSRLGWLGGDAPELVEQARVRAQGAEQLRIAQLQFALGDRMGAPSEGAAQSRAVEQPPSEENASAGVAVGSPRAALPALLGGLIVVVMMGVGGFFLVRFVGSRASQTESSPVVIPPGNGPARNDEAVTPIAAADEEAERGAPVARFMTTYLLGDDLYDDSFSIDDANGDFLGECGMGVSDTIGVGEPKKVCAFEIWLFDKNDVRTVTKVLMSEDAFGDEEKRGALAPKGEPMMASPGSTMVLDTASLYVRARVMDMQYGSGALPQNSFFHQLTIELAAWKKA